MHTVAAVLVDEVAAFELGVACEVFGLVRPELGVAWYRFLVCAAEPPPLRSSGGMLIDTPHGLAALAQADTLVFPSWRSPAEQPPAALLAAVRAAAARGARLVSICSGAFILAAAGVLDGRPATTHWRYAEELAARYPRIRVAPDVLYVDAGQVLTSAGTAAAIDLCLHIVRSDYGAEIANAVARRMVVSPHRDGGQAQFIDRPVAAVAAVGSLRPALTWAMEHLDSPHSVLDLARRAAMSPRTFARRFRAEYGTTPHRWLLHQRLLLARRWLENGAESVDGVAERSGFGSAAVLRLHFRRAFATSPHAYRRQFGPAETKSNSAEPGRTPIGLDGLATV
ncbi:MAG TPA: transcriptional regulator FtrA [Chloroflexota bacterium]|jgi:AraC family transcriptional activator FtrA|nr:transcriptional regulator FtrA [Chloroflexota bacterium]